MAISAKRAKILIKILIVLAVLAVPFLVLLKRADMIQFGGPAIISVKWYNTLTKQEKIHRAEVWYKLGAYRNTYEIYTELLFGMKANKMRRMDYGFLPIDRTLPRADLMYCRWCICLSKLNKRTQGMNACNQFLDEFPESKYRERIEKLEMELRGRQL